MDQKVIHTPSSALETLKDTTAVKSRYDNFIGGEWVKPKNGEYFENTK